MRRRLLSVSWPFSAVYSSRDANDQTAGTIRAYAGRAARGAGLAPGAKLAGLPSAEPVGGPPPRAAGRPAVAGRQRGQRPRLPAPGAVAGAAGADAGRARLLRQR